MILLRRVLGDALRARRQAQQRTLREVSGAANVSLGYLSEIERGHKEASSELLSAICDALGAHLSEVLREVSDTLEFAELTAEADRGRLTPAGVGAGGTTAGGRTAAGGGTAGGVGRGGSGTEGAGEAVSASGPSRTDAPIAFTASGSGTTGTVTNFVGDGAVSVAVRRDGPLRTTLRATRTAANRRDVARVA
jgi:DNA-binding Xre family transcriptional regulator